MKLEATSEDSGRIPSVWVYNWQRACDRNGEMISRIFKPWNVQATPRLWSVSHAKIQLRMAERGIEGDVEGA